MLTIQEANGFKVFKSPRSSTAVVIWVQEDDGRFILPLELTRAGLPHSASKDQVQQYVLERSYQFTEAVQRRLSRYEALTGRTLKVHLHDINYEVDIRIDIISDERFTYSFAWESEQITGTLRFDRSSHEHVLYVDDEGFSPEGWGMLESCIVTEISIHQRKKDRPIAAIEEYVNQRPALPSSLTRFLHPSF